MNKPRNQPRNQPRKTSRGLKFLLLLLLLLIIAVAVLPMLASTDWARGKILSKVNESAPGTVEVDDWSVGWFGKLNASGVKYTDENGTLLADVKKVDASYGLFDLITRKKNLTLTLTEPHLLVPAGSYVNTASAPATSGGGGGPDKTVGTPPPANDDASQGGEPSEPSEPLKIGKLLEKLPASVNLVVKGGVLNLQGVGSYMHNLELDTTFKKADRALAIRSSFDAPDRSGKMVIEGNVDVPDGDKINPLASVVDLAVDGTNWDLAPALAFGKSYVPDLPGGTARLQSKIDIKGSPVSGFSGKGSASLLGVDLQGGGYLKGDRPQFAEARFDFDAVQNGSQVELKSLGVTSPYLNGSLAANLVGLPSEIDTELPPFDMLKQVLSARGSANGSFDVNLPILFQQFPNNLSLKDGLRVTQGSVNLGINADLKDDRQWAVMSLGLNQPLVAERPGAPTAIINPPMIVTGMVNRVGNGDPTVIADVSSAFLAGRADLSRAELVAAFDVDLTEAHAELNPIFDFAPWDFSGKGRVDARVANYDQPENHISFNANMNQLLVKKADTAFLQEPAFIGGGEATVNRDTMRLTKGKIKADSQILKGTGGFDAIQLNKDGGPPSEVSGLNFDGALNLERGVDLLKGLGVAPTNITASGTANLNLNVGMEGDTIVLPPTTLSVDQLKLAMRDKLGNEAEFDDPSLKVTLQGKLDPKAETVNVPALTLKSRLANVTLDNLTASNYSSADTRKVSASLRQATFQLGPIGELLRATGKLEQDISMGGVASISPTRVNVNGESIALDPTTLAIDNMSVAMRDSEDRLQTYKDPRLEVTLSGTLDPKKGFFDLPQLALKSRLAKVKLSQVRASNVDKPTVRRAGANIDQGEFYLGPIVELLRASGKLTNQLTATGTAVLSADQAGVNGNNASINNVNLTIFRPELALASDGVTRRFTDEQISLGLQNLSANLDTMDAGASTVTLNSAGFGSMRIDDLKGTKLTDEVQRTLNARVNGDLRLRPLGDLASTLGVMPTTLSMAGQFKPEASVSMNGNSVSMSTRQTAFNNFSAVVDGKVLQPVSGTLAGDITADLNRRSLDARNLDFGLRDQSELLRVGPGSASVGDWSNAMQSLAANATLRADLGGLVAKAGGFVSMPEGSRVAGLLDGNISTTGQGEGQTLNLTSNISGFKFYKDNKPLLQEEVVKLNANAKRDLANDRLVLESMELNSTPLQINAVGSINRMSRDDKAVFLDGQLGFDLDRLQPIVRELTGQPITMRGKKMEPFNLTTTLGDNMIANTTLKAGFHADFIEAFGIQISELAMPINVINGYGDVKLRSGIAGGLLNVNPRIGTVEGIEGLAITLPPNSSVLTNFTLTSAMTDGLLGKLHPVFKGTAASGGKVDLFMNNFVAPVENLEAIKFAGSVGLQGAQLEANGIIRMLMNLMKVRETTYTIDNTIMGFQAVNQRVYSGDLKIRIDGVPVIIGGRGPNSPGSVGFDKSIDFVARVPLTGNLVPAEVQRYAGTNFVVNVPIYGTVDSPKLDQRSIKAAIADLTRQVAIGAAQQAAGKELGKLLGKDNLGAGNDIVGGIIGGILGGNNNQAQPNPNLQNTDRPGMRPTTPGGAQPGVAQPGVATQPGAQQPAQPQNPFNVFNQGGQPGGSQPGGSQPVQPAQPQQGQIRQPGQVQPGQPGGSQPQQPAQPQPDIFDNIFGGKPKPAAPGEAAPKRSTEDELRDAGKDILRGLFK